MKTVLNGEDCTVFRQECQRVEAARMACAFSQEGKCVRASNHFSKMAEQIIINIARPEVGIEYRAESQEAELPDRLAASELALHALARHVQELCAELGMSCPKVIVDLVQSDTWQHGM